MKEEPSEGSLQEAIGKDFYLLKSKWLGLRDDIRLGNRDYGVIARRWSP